MSIPQSGGGPIETFAQLADFMAAGCKPKDQWRIGTEHEKFGYLTDTHAPLPYAGDRSISALFAGLEARYGWKPLR
ncbi:MAG: glutamate--cysteine ligase, partial [Rhodobacteraceae bacterium]|nr:glutamate--cysteine ligase [Paracoccaceae bacterium]